MLQDQVNTGLQYPHDKELIVRMRGQNEENKDSLFYSWVLPHDEELMIRLRGQNEENKDSLFYSWVNQDLIIKVSI
jgi:hypothetical protein